MLNNPRIGMTFIPLLNTKIGDQFFRGGGNVMDQPSIYSLPLALIGIDKNQKFRSFKSKENIHKKEVGPYR